MLTLIGLAWRNLWRNARRTAITALSIALGYAMSLIVFGLNDGAHEQMIRNGIKLGDGHVAVQPEGYQASPANHVFLAEGGAVLEAVRASGVPGRVVPRISLQVLASTAENSIGVQLLGMDPTTDPQMDSLRESLREGAPIAPGDARGLLIGTRMAEKLGASVGSKVVVMAGKSGGDTEAHLARVRGIFRTGIDELDGYVVFSGLELARRFLIAEGGDAAAEPLTRVAVFLDQQERTAEVKARLQALPLPEGTAVLDWRELMPQLVSFVIVDDVGNYIIVGLLLLLVAFGILNTILMSVLERTREFGLLRALGMGRGRLLALVVVETVILAAVALLAGCVIGGALHGYWAVYGLDLSGAYGEEGMQGTGYYIEPIVYSSLSPARVLELTVLVFGATMLSGIYPAVRAARVAPIRAIQT